MDRATSAAGYMRQTVHDPPAPHGGGYDAARRTKGRKRHRVVDTDTRLRMVNLTTADVADAAGAEEIVEAARKRGPWLEHLFIDGVYEQGRLARRFPYRDFSLLVGHELSDQKGFQILPRRWVLERTFGGMTRWRRLVRNDEERPDVSGAMIDVAMGKPPAPPHQLPIGTLKRALEAKRFADEAFSILSNIAQRFDTFERYIARMFHVAA